MQNPFQQGKGVLSRIKDKGAISKKAPRMKRKTEELIEQVKKEGNKKP